MKWTQKTLEIFGLTATQTKILSSLGIERTLSEIVRETQISRTGINYCLTQLVKRGLAYRKKYNKRFYYRAMSSQELSEKLEAITLQLQVENGVSKNVKVRTSKESEFVIFRGIKEIIPAYEGIALLNKNERLRAIQPNKSWINLHKKLSSSQLIRVNNALRDNNIILEAILQKNAYTLYEKFFQNDPEKIADIAKSFTGRMADYTLVSQTLFDYHAELWIFKHTGLMINWEEEIALEITNENLVGFLRDLFEIAKASGIKVDHNGMMKEMIKKNMISSKTLLTPIFPPIP
jgi:predicted transcriptional regulator